MDNSNTAFAILIVIFFLSLLFYVLFKVFMKPVLDSRAIDNTKMAEMQALLNNYEKTLIEKSAELNAKELSIKNIISEYEKNEAQMKLKSQWWAMMELEKYKATELEKAKKILEENALASASNLLAQWKAENTIEIRRKAISQSYAVTLGKISEHLVPFHPNFPFNPQDVKFIGQPIDMIVFDGLAEGYEDIDIYFLEIKTGNGKLSDKQRLIKKALAKKPVIWYEMRADSL